jgi:predicted Fe-Mo cluster-binding NifX family protein
MVVCFFDYIVFIQLFHGGTQNAVYKYDMRLAIPHWQGRVSPVFDVAGSLLLIDVDRSGEISRQDIALSEDTSWGRAKHVADLHVDMLICGAVSRPLELALVSAGIQVFPQTCGDVEQVLAAYATGKLRQESFLMPGCHGRRRRFRRGGRGG